MHARNGHPRRFATARTALLIAPLAALAVACGSAGASSHGGPVSPGADGPSHGTRSPGGTGGTGGTGSSTGTSGGASCAYLTQPRLQAMARLVFIGTMLPGRTIDGPDGLLVSPARVRVERYIKGSGPAVVTVETAVISTGNGEAAEGIMAHPGQTWKIYTTSRHQPFLTSDCDGSHSTAGVSGTP